ncbi:MAG: tRNA pseudouridine(38-40) synthase TruA [Cyclobacteriaceae bacterium]
MQHRPYTYLFRIQYLGLRYHGWQVQPGVKTIQGTLEKTFRHVLGHDDFNILGASRTDSGVSSLHGAFELFMKKKLDVTQIIAPINEYLPSDIRVLNCRQVPLDFNIIQDVSQKQYGYYFTFGEKPHPFLAGGLAYVGESLDLDRMRAAASLMVGQHDFRRFSTHGKKTEDFVRTINQAEIVFPQADQNFWPRKNVWVLRVKAKGFLMHQVRRMAAALFLVGKGTLDIQELQAALNSLEKKPLAPKAPAMGLVLEEVFFKGLDN